RAVTVVNRMLPGPSIKVCEGDQIIVRLNNKLDNGEGTTIHWHGITQRGTPWMDGVPMITQCAIPSGTNFVYNFTAYPAGTHWWHGHSGFHRSDGAFGSFIVKKPALSNLHWDAYDEDKHTILVGDWLHQTTMEKYIQHHHSSGNNKGEGMLINGKGEHGYQKNGSTVYTPMMKYTVESLKRYRFRVINNAAVFCPFELSVDGHQLNIIATDGIDVTSHTVTSLVGGGERFDFVLNANQTPSSYWVRIQGLADCRNSSQRAVLWYNGTTTQRPTSTADVGNTTKLNPLNEKETERVKFVTSLSTLTPLDVRLAQKPDLVHFVGFDFKLVDNTRYHDSMHYPIRAVPRNHHLYSPQLNNVSFVPSSSPLLSQYDDVDQSLICDTFRDINVPSTTVLTPSAILQFRACTHIVDIKLGSTVELVVFDEGRTFNAGHPMHLHGHHFAVVAMNKIKSTLSLDEIQEIYANGSIAYNFENTVMKDSVIVPDGGYVVIRFVADNPGIWSFHCHLSFHQEAGMLMAFRVGEEVYEKNIPENFPKCGNWRAIERKS
uniref:ferroxidase n=1 Tax=Ciona savignyi TaxID=51511 RepID=H2YGT3_CIOSA